MHKFLQMKKNSNKTWLKQIKICTCSYFKLCFASLLVRFVMCLLLSFFCLMLFLLGLVCCWSSSLWQVSKVELANRKDNIHYYSRKVLNVRVTSVYTCATVPKRYSFTLHAVLPPTVILTHHKISAILPQYESGRILASLIQSGPIKTSG